MLAGSYLKIFGLTCLFEAPFYFWGLAGANRSFATKLAAVVILNLSTHPLVGLGFPQFFALNELPRADSILFSEIFVPVVEGLGLFFLLGLSARRAACVSCFANLFSWWFGGWLIGVF
jgi:hypothetical protein